MSETLWAQALRPYKNAGNKSGFVIKSINPSRLFFRLIVERY